MFYLNITLILDWFGQASETDSLATEATLFDLVPVMEAPKVSQDLRAVLTPVVISSKSSGF